MARTVDTELLGLLSDGETWTGVRLAERLGVGLRTVRRAVARLRADGVILDAAGVDVAPRDRATLERLCRYISRPPVASERLALTPSGQVR